MKKFIGKVQQGMNKFDQDRRAGKVMATAQTTFDALPPTSSMPRPRAATSIVIESNAESTSALGSLEAWLTPSLFQKARDPKASELDVVAGMDPNEARAMLENHWDNFINDGDLQWMVDHGINTVRIPVGYFHFLAGHPNESVRALIKDTDYERYAPIYAGAFSRIQRAIEFTASRNVGVLVDLHGAPGGQNADAHCGVSDGKAALWDSPPISKRPSRS